MIAEHGLQKGARPTDGSGQQRSLGIKAGEPVGCRLPKLLTGPSSQAFEVRSNPLCQSAKMSDA